MVIQFSIMKFNFSTYFMFIFLLKQRIFMNKISMDLYYFN